MNNFRNKLLNLPNGTFFALYKDEKYLLTKNMVASNKIVKLYAINLRNKDIVSCNYFINIKGGLLKPCEMSEQKVINFVLGLKYL